MIIKDNKELQIPCEDASLFEAPTIIKKLDEDLQASMSGVGLAANQIGIKKRVCIIRVDKPIDLVNPVIEDLRDLREFDGEGCLSFPGEWLTTHRYNEVFVKDLYHPAGIVCTGFEAVVVQHEVGHTGGEVMYDYQIKRPGRNEPCWCGSNRKYKKCHAGKVIK